MFSLYFTSCSLQTHNLHILTISVFICYIGWEPGPQEGLIEWDEDWDKFEDEG